MRADALADFCERAHDVRHGCVPRVPRPSSVDRTTSRRRLSASCASRRFRGELPDGEPAPGSDRGPDGRGTGRTAGHGLCAVGGSAARHGFVRFHPADDRLCARRQRSADIRRPGDSGLADAGAGSEHARDRGHGFIHRARRAGDGDDRRDSTGDGRTAPGLSRQLSFLSGAGRIHVRRRGHHRSRSAATRPRRQPGAAPAVVSNRDGRTRTRRPGEPDHCRDRCRLHRRTVGSTTLGADRTGRTRSRHRMHCSRLCVGTG